MNLPAVVHRPTPEYIYPRARDQLTIQITTAREDVKQCSSTTQLMSFLIYCKNRGLQK